MTDIAQDGLTFSAATVTGDAWMRLTCGDDTYEAPDEESARAFAAAATEAGLSIGSPAPY